MNQKVKTELDKIVSTLAETGVTLYFEGVGDWTQERHEQPEENCEDFRAGLGRVDEQIRGRRGMS